MNSGDEINKQRGGARVGAGRKRSKVKELSKTMPDKFFEAVGGELDAWKEFMDEVKPRTEEIGCACGHPDCEGLKTVRLGDVKAWGDALKYWTDRKYGKALQGITGPNGGPIQVITNAQFPPP